MVSRVVCSATSPRTSAVSGVRTMSRPGEGGGGASPPQAATTNMVRARLRILNRVIVSSPAGATLRSPPLARMEWLLPAMAAVIGAIVAAILARSRAHRQLAEARAETAAELAATKQDNKWLTEEVARQKQAIETTKVLL